MARTKRPAAVTSAAATENADTPANLKRHRRSVKAPSKTIEAFVLHDIDEPVPPPTTETLSVDEANIDELAIAFPSTGSNAYLKYHLPEGQAEVEPQLMALLENWEEDEDLAAMQQNSAQVQNEGISEAVAADFLLHEQLIESATFFPLPPELVENHVDSPTGRYIGPKSSIVAELSEVLIQPVMTGQRPVIDPETATYVYQKGYGLTHESFELALPPSTDPATIASVTLNSFKSVEHTDPYFDLRNRVVRQGKNGERQNRASGFLHPFPIYDKEICFRSLWVYPDSTHALIPADALPFVQAQFTTTSDGIFHDGIRPDMMPFVRVVVRPIRGHKYPLPTDGDAKYTYMWSLYLRTDAINNAVETHDRAALTAIRNVLSLVVKLRHWLKGDLTSNRHAGAIPSTSDPDIFALPTSLPSSITSLPSTDLNDTQRVCLAWLLKRELLDDRSIKVYPSNTTINTHLIRFGPNGAYYEPYTARFFTAAQRDSIRVLAQPEPPVSITCTDSILKSSGPFCPHKIGIILALIQANPLKLPRPIPDRTRDLIPTRATLIVCTQASLAEWVVQARRKFPGPGQVIVMDSSHDYTAVTLAQAQAADVVLISDVFVLTLYNRSLSHMVNTEHACARPVSLMPHRERHRDPHMCPIAKAQSSSLGEADSLTDTPPTQLDTNPFRRGDYWIKLFGSRIGSSDCAFYHDSPATSISEMFTESLLAGTTGESPICTPLHLLFWHRLILDGVSFTTPSPIGPHEYRSYNNMPTPLHELASTSTVIIFPRKASERTNSDPLVDTAALYRTIGINQPDSPSGNLSVQGQADLIGRISLAIVPVQIDLAPPLPIISVETVPVYLDLLEATRSVIIADLVHDSLALSIRAIQHHLVPLNLQSRATSAYETSRHSGAPTSAVYDAYSATQPGDIPFHHDWQKWHHLAVYRAKRRWPLYDNFLYPYDDNSRGRLFSNLSDGLLWPARPNRAVDPKVVDDWMPDDYNDDDEFNGFSEDRMSWYAWHVRANIQSVISKTSACVLAKIRDSLQSFLETSPHVASRAKHFDDLCAQLRRCRDGASDSWRNRIGEMCLERGFTLKEVLAVGMDVSIERQADAEDMVKSSWHWHWYTNTLASQDISQIHEGELQGDAIKRILELRQVLDLSHSVDWARQSVALANLALSEGQRIPCKLCPSCQNGFISDADVVASHPCSFKSCLPCSTVHASSCHLCRAHVSVHHPSLIVQHHPVACQRIDDGWVQLLRSRDAVDSVDSFCSRLCKNKDGTDAMVPTFLDVFGAKIQAVILYIHQQLALDPTAKFVAFTEYTFQFHLLGLALHLVNVQAEQVIDGASAYPPILAFKSDPNVRVLIMPFSKCAAGINLSEATHVLFLHPYAGRSESPWGRDKSTWFTSYSQFAPPPTAHVTMLNEERKQVWGEWERRCVEMVAMGKETHRHSPVRIARFAIQHSIEERFGWDSWSQV